MASRKRRGGPISDAEHFRNQRAADKRRLRKALPDLDTLRELGDRLIMMARLWRMPPAKIARALDDVAKVALEKAQEIHKGRNIAMQVEIWDRPKKRRRA